MFESLARLVVRFRWLVVAAWVIGAVLGTRLLPSLSTVTQSSNGQFLQSSAPSQRAAALAAPFQAQNTGAAALIVAYRADGPLMPGDDAAISTVEQEVDGVAGVTLVKDLGTSSDGQVREALVVTDTPAQSNQGNPAVVHAIRSIFGSPGQPPGLELHLTGPLAQTTDAAANSARTGTAIRAGTVLVVIVLLFAVYRSILAPLVTLLPAVMALAVSQGLIALASEIGVPVSIATGTLLPVLLIGAGADYGIFLVFRVREEIQGGAAPSDALVTALGRVGESITFSGATVVAALCCLLVATFGLYRGLGPSLAIGVAVVLLAALTLLPALIAILGRFTFWPSHPASGQPSIGIWGKVAARAAGRPWLVIALGLVLFGGLSAGLTSFSTGGFTSPPATGTDSQRGADILAAHFPAALSNAEILVLRFAQPVSEESPALTSAATDLQSDPAIRKITGPVVSKDGRSVEFLAVPAAGSTGTNTAIDAIPALRAALAAAAAKAGATDSGVAGVDAVAYDINHTSATDLLLVVPVVLIAIAILLAILVRSLVAPLYLIATVALSYLASLGFASFVFIKLAGDAGLNFVIPILLFIFAMALGEDYNILLMTRVREEARKSSLHEALVLAVGRTGGTISSAGVILAGTFTVLAIAGGSGQSLQLGFTIAFAILLDTFFVRTLLVPAIAVLLDRWNWWPSRLSSATPAREGARSL
ncbi:MAG TPA: MMPL family transporter [Candidatus Dormibacteraeota bacterium]|nr:MMPL family transporter [Candidatus Dormibacteraeota bacterium]